ncbi:hypothetical protein INR49_027885 [Caranx melampygus]|nr:hypothetical protein INR49_027885 [Caranx melampygus]
MVELSPSWMERSTKTLMISAVMTSWWHSAEISAEEEYSLCAVFHSACMIEEPGEPIQFEVSIGNYGNKLDSTCKPMASTTSTALLCLMESHLTSLKTAILAKVPETQLAEIWLKLIDHMIEDLQSVQLPVLEGKPNPQNSMPDVVIWMLRREKRVAYARVPANQILYSNLSEQACGKHCGKIQTIFMQYPMDKNKGVKIPVQLRVNMWFGLSAHEKKFNSFSEGNFSVYAEMNGEKAQSPGEFDCPPGWSWEDEWSFDSNRAVDERETRTGGRLGILFLIGWKFHRKERSSDTFRRRCWRRKMVPSDCIGASAIFKLEGALGVDVDEKANKMDAAKLFGANTPTVSCHFSRSYIYHLRVYVYQARNLCAMDKDSFSDPYAHVSFLHVSKTTEVIRTTLNPTWDQTLIFEDIEIYGDPQTLARNPPDVVLELFDSDQVGKDEPMGRCTCPPVVKLNPSVGVTPKLLWFPVTKKGRNAGEALLAAELLLKDKANEGDLPLVPPRRGEKLYMVPQGIRPVVHLTAIEVLTWGLRNMKTYQLAAVSSPSLVVECGGEIVQTAVIKNFKKNPNFPGSVLMLKVLLPKEEMYTPPIVLKVIDHRPFGRKPVVGQCTIDCLDQFRCDPYRLNNDVCMSARVAMIAAAQGDVVIDIDERPIVKAELQTEKEEEAVDWWSKFFASVGEQEKCGPYLKKGYDTLQVYNSELEEVTQFQGLTDFCSTFKLQRGKTEDEEEDPSVVGEFKGSFKIYPLSDDPGVPAPPRQFRELPESGPQECLVRIYVVRCIDLQPKDTNGMCDPYVKITLGRKTLDDRDNYKPNTLNPEFGRMFELSCFLPQDKDLKIAVYDYDLLSRDEKVGETVIDLENRLLSRFRSCCGLPQTYCVSGINQWRDQLKPSQILQNVARVRGVPPPHIEADGTSLSFSGKLYNLQDFETNKVIHPHMGPARERLALHVLRDQGLVPEHVETRTLCSSHQPNLSQGRIQMWVDIFPKNLGWPGPPCDITPRKAKKYFLRAIVWNTTDVILDETSITGESMSDIYVKGWMPGMEDDKQKTDVHYRSLDGDGNFNWRFILGLTICLQSSCVSSRGKIPPKLIIQIWDNDKFSLDDYLEKCSLKMLPGVAGSSTAKRPLSNSLFSQKSVRGWWPCAIEQDGKHGKVEMTLEIVEEKEMEERPAGKGRDEPNMNPKLDPPNRPDTSFFWFTNPCKTMKFIVWRRFRWIFIGVILLLLVILFLGILFYSLPTNVMIGQESPAVKAKQLQQRNETILFISSDLLKMDEMMDSQKSVTAEVKPEGVKNDVTQTKSTDGKDELFCEVHKHDSTKDSLPTESMQDDMASQNSMDCGSVGGLDESGLAGTRSNATQANCSNGQKSKRPSSPGPHPVKATCVDALSPNPKLTLCLSSSPKKGVITPGDVEMLSPDSPICKTMLINNSADKDHDGSVCAEDSGSAKAQVVDSQQFVNDSDCGSLAKERAQLVTMGTEDAETDLLREGEVPVPYPTKFKDAWDDMSVKMPCSEKNLFPVETEDGGGVQSRWDLIRTALRGGFKSSLDVRDAILRYNTTHAKKWDFTALNLLCTECLEHCEVQHLFEVILPTMVDLALSAPCLCTMVSAISCEFSHLTCIKNCFIRKEDLERRGLSLFCHPDDVFCFQFPVEVQDKPLPDSVSGANSLSPGQRLLLHIPRRNSRKSEYCNYPEINFYRAQGPCYIYQTNIESSPKLGKLSDSSYALHITCEGTIEDDGYGMLQVRIILYTLASRLGE